MTGQGTDLSNNRDSLATEMLAEITSPPATYMEVCRIYEERARQKAKFGEQSYHDGKWLMVLVEEVGEVAKELNEEKNSVIRAERVEYLERLRKEVIQCAAVSTAWAEKLTARIKALQS